MITKRKNIVIMLNDLQALIVTCYKLITVEILFPKEVTKL